MTIMKWVAVGLFVLGGFICCVNFYLSFLRYPIHRLRGGTRESYKWVSGVPLFGSFFVALSLLKFWSQPYPCAIAIILILIDTGGLHWFLGVMFYFEVFRKKSAMCNGDTEKENTRS
ncbi:MAG: hypothetical protein K8R46_04810 [Pirellulales bacterium]|nr:hypothetical protein [Pirellulales bacterium]